MKDAEIDYSDIPPLDKSFFTKATEAWPPAKQQLTIRLDADVLNWLRAIEVIRRASIVFFEPPWRARRRAGCALRRRRK